jgi:ABC-2 type transport system ATP-binding protein
MLELKSITKVYGSVIGVNDINLDLEPGAYGLVGPNGAGKTTLLNLITGQLRPTIGSVRVFGMSPWNEARVLRRVGLCPAADVLHDQVSALEWVSYLVELYGFGRREARRRATEALERVGLAEAMHRTLSTYSRGMRQRAKLAQAAAHEPEFLLLDEPFNGLDPVGRHQMSEWLRDWTRGGKSLLMASHILHEVEAVSKAFLLICGGRLLASGTAEEVRALLADLPHEVEIRCDRPSVVAQRLLRDGLADGIRFLDGQQALVAATRNPLQLYDALPRWIEEDGLKVSELRSPDESLQLLFESLLKLHRGE